MDLRQLRYLLAIAEERHVGRAADRLHVSQPALSQQLRRLEEEVGRALFERHARGMRLTPEGEVLVRYGAQVMEKLREAREELDALGGLSEGCVTVGVLQSVNSRLMPAAVALMMGDYPKVRIRLRELSGGQIEDGVVEGELDFGVGFVPPRRDELEWEPLFTEALRLVVPTTHPIARAKGIEVRQLNELPMALLSEKFVARQLLDAALQQAGAVPRVVVETNTLASLMEVAMRAALPTVLPELVGGPADSVSVALRNPSPRRSVGLLWRLDGVRAEAATALAARFRTAVERTGLREDSGTP